MEKDDPLKELLVDEGEVNREVLATTLKRFVRIGKQGAIILTVEGAGLNSERRIIAILLARKAMVELGLISDSEGLTPSGLESATGIQGGTLRPALKRLRGRRLVAQAKGAYFVPNYALEEACSFLQT